MFKLFKNKKIIFTDLFDQKFYLTRKDNLRMYKKRKSVTDAINVINYINKNKYNLSIDLGANLGAVSVAMWKNSLNNGVVYSVEADPNNYIRIKENLNLNNFNSSYVFNFAINDKISPVTLNVYDDANGWQNISEKGAEFTHGHNFEKVEVFGIDFLSFINIFEIGDIDLIKIDIEGLEFKVINSFLNLLESRKIKEVIFEVNSPTLSSFGSTKQELLALWLDLDYELFVIKDDGSTFLLNEKFILENEFFDCLAKLKI
jgi:FkbM family methyltransferase